MATDETLSHYGRAYHLLIDPVLKAHRDSVFDRVTPGTAVLDVGCGTGELAFALREDRGCRVVGADLSQKMLGFSTVCQLLHEPPSRRSAQRWDVRGEASSHRVLRHHPGLHELEQIVRASGL
jgi:SAM-dependent methyltransferase